MQEAAFRLPLSRSNKPVLVREGVEQLLGYSVAEFRKGTADLFELLHPEDASALRSLLSSQNIPRHGHLRLRVRHRDQRIRCLVALYQLEGDGETAVLHLILQDAKTVTPDKDERRALSESPTVIENVAADVVCKDRNHVIVQANRAARHALQSTGLASQPILGLTDYDLGPEAVADRNYAAEERILAGSPLEREVRRQVDADGKVAWSETSRFPIKNSSGEVIGTYGMARDVTSHMLAEEALRESEASLLEAQKIAGLGSYVLDLATGIWSASAVMRQILGIDENYERTVAGWTALIHPDDRSALAAYFEHEVLGKKQQFDRAYRILRHDTGEARWVHGLGQLDFDTDGHILRMRGTIQDVTRRHQDEAQLRESKELLQLFIEHAPAALAMFDRQMRYVAASNRWLQDYGLNGAEIAGRSHYDVFPDLPERWRDAHRRGLAGEGVRSEEDQFVRSDGRVQWLRWELIPWRAQDGTVGGIVLFSEDITAIKAHEERLKLAASVFHHASEGIMITDARGIILDVNDAFTRITGYTREEAAGQTPRILNSGRQNREFYADMWGELTSKGRWSGEIWNRAKNGQLYAEMLTISAVPDAAGKTQQYVGLFSDITSIKEQELQLQRVAHYDLLTGLPNRVLLADRLHQAMAQAHRGGRMVAIACLDLDDFRAVNDRHGHIVGDQLLTALTQRMSALLREGDTLARLGGDELVVVLLEQTGIEDTLVLVKQLLDAAAGPVQLGELTLQVSASIGVTLFPQTEDVDPDQLLRQADQAMYHAKVAGKGRYHVFDPRLDRSVRGHHEDMNRLRAALLADEFVLHYQPKVDMCTGAILGTEALVRWQHPQQGLLSPSQFLPIVHGNGLVVELGEWVIAGALAQIERWQQEGLHIPVSVNIDAHHLQQPDFVERLGALLAKYPAVSPAMLELEVLESSALQDVAQVSQVIRACTRLGLSFALDDFGTGYSSLSYLKRLPVHVLKIDQSFVHDMLDDPEDLSIMEGVLGLASSFGHMAVAEGVETIEHGLMLLRMGCRAAQGNVIARPMPGSELAAWAAHWRPDPRWVTASPVSPSNFPMLYSAVEHRAWVKAIEDYLKDLRHSPPEVDHHLCRFGSWMDAEAAAGRGNRPGFRSIDILHQRMHTYAAELVRVKGFQGKTAALAHMPELHSLNEKLQEKLHYMVQSL